MTLKSFIGEFFPQYINYYNSEEKTLTLWNWDYSQYLDFIKSTQLFLRENPKEYLFITCSHPHVFTHGSGLQKGLSKETKLINFDSQTSLNFPLFQIKRGGGLTFHYPGQVIIYPLLNLNSFRSSAPKIMLLTLKAIKEFLEYEFEMQDLEYKKEPLGLWYQNIKKLASSGMGLERFITSHGTAFNLCNDIQMFDSLATISPCGLSSQSYTTLERVLGKTYSLEEQDRFGKKITLFIINRLIKS